LGAAATVVNVFWFRLVVAALAVCGALALAVITTREQRAEGREEEYTASGRLLAPITELGNANPSAGS
jgi:hypothetical protein